MNKVLNDVLNWFTANNLLLNSNTTKCVGFTMPSVKQLGTYFTLISIVDSTVFLRITLDSKLQCGAQTDSLAGRISFAAYAVWKVRQFTETD